MCEIFVYFSCRFPFLILLLQIFDPTKFIRIWWSLFNGPISMAIVSFLNYELWLIMLVCCVIKYWCNCPVPRARHKFTTINGHWAMYMDHWIRRSIICSTAIALQDYTITGALAGEQTRYSAQRPPLEITWFSCPDRTLKIMSQIKFDF